MYEELIKRLRETSMDFGQADHVSVMLLEAADAIEELDAINQRQMMEIAVLSKLKWISVTERLPEVGKNVLVFAYGNEITIGRMKRQTENGYHVFIICHGIARELARPGRITHWMPLPSAPEPPKEE